MEWPYYYQTLRQTFYINHPTEPYVNRYNYHTHFMYELIEAEEGMLLD